MIFFLTDSYLHLYRSDSHCDAGYKSNLCAGAQNEAIPTTRSVLLSFIVVAGSRRAATRVNRGRTVTHLPSGACALRARELTDSADH